MKIRVTSELAHIKDQEYVFAKPGDIGTLLFYDGEHKLFKTKVNGEYAWLNADQFEVLDSGFDNDPDEDTYLNRGDTL